MAEYRVVREATLQVVSNALTREQAEAFRITRFDDPEAYCVIEVTPEVVLIWRDWGGHDVPAMDAYDGPEFQLRLFVDLRDTELRAH